MVSLPVEFDISHAILLEKPLQETLHVQRTVPLVDALRQNTIAPATQVLVSELPDQPLVFETWHLIAHPIAEGTWQDLNYAAAFCAVCNSAVLFDAEVNGVVYHFTQGGLYNAMLLMRDVETGSYWDHIAGECLYGPLKGTRLKRLNTLLYMTAKQAAAAYANASLVKGQLNKAQSEMARQRDIPRLQAEPDYGPLIGPAVAASIGTTEDKRLPRFEMGLGVWVNDSACYYPLKQIGEQGALILDRLGGQTLLVYLDPQSNTPSAIYVDSTSAVWQNDTTIQLDRGLIVRDGLIVQPDGEMAVGEHPSQLFQRWVGFSQTFPNCRVYGQ